MNILLTAINAKYIHSNLAVYSLQAYARKYGQEINLAEYTINHRTEYILEELYRKQPDVLCFSCYIWNIEYVKELAGELKRLCPDMEIWAGGPEVSFETEQFLKENAAFRGVMRGEGEQTFLELVRYYRGEFEKKPEAIAGLVFRDENQKIVKTGERDILDMNMLPFCYEDLTEFEHRIIYYESSRGCPYSCSYCLSSVDKRLRFRSLEYVLKELQFFIDHKVQQVKFVDRTFNCSRRHADAIWNYLLEHDNGITNFHFEVSADLLDEEQLELIRKMRPGLIQLEIGVQSVNPQTIREIKRTMNLPKLKENVCRIQEAENVHQHLDLIAGLPFEDFFSFRNSFDEIYGLHPEQLQLGFLKILKGSYMYEHCRDYQILYRRKPPYEVLSTRWLSFDDILSIRRIEEMVEIHYNSHQFEQALHILETEYTSPFLMYQELGEYYFKTGYMGQKFSRMRRCEIVLEFVRERFPWQAENMGEALLFDLYAREKMKSRPYWAADLSAWKKAQLAYLQHAGKEKKYCHLEFFSVDFLEKTGKWSKEIQKYSEGADGKIWVLFEYEQRNPLTGQAKTSFVDLSAWQ